MPLLSGRFSRILQSNHCRTLSSASVCSNYLRCKFLSAVSWELNIVNFVCLITTSWFTRILIQSCIPYFVVNLFLCHLLSYDNVEWVLRLLWLISNPRKHSLSTAQSCRTKFPFAHSYCRRSFPRTPVSSLISHCWVFKLEVEDSMCLAMAQTSGTVSI